MYAIYGNMDPINIPQMLAYIPYMDPMGYVFYTRLLFHRFFGKFVSQTISKMTSHPRKSRGLFSPVALVQECQASIVSIWQI